MREYKHNYNLYLGNHREIFNPTLPEMKFDGKQSKEAVYIQSNLPRTVVDVHSYLLFPTGVNQAPFKVEYDSEGQEKEVVERIQKDIPDLSTKLRQSARCALYASVAVLELAQDPDTEEFRLLQHDPRLWFPEFGDMGELKNHELRFILKNKDTEYVRVRRFEKTKSGCDLTDKIYEMPTGEVKEQPSTTWQEVDATTYSAFRDKDDNDEQIMGTEESLPTMPIYAVLNANDGIGNFGNSIYKGMFETFRALNFVKSFIQHLNHNNADPFVVIPKKMARMKGNAHGRIDHEVHTPSTVASKFILEDLETKGTTRIVSWDSELRSMFEQEKSLISQIAYESHLPASMFSDEQAGSGEAAEALRLRFHTTSSYVRERQEEWKGAIRWLYQTVQMMMSETSEPGTYSVQFGDPMPQSVDEIVKLLETMKALGLLSNEGIIRYFQGGILNRDEEEIDADLEEINKERRPLPTGAPLTRDITADNPTLNGQQEQPAA